MVGSLASGCVSTEVVWLSAGLVVPEEELPDEFVSLRRRRALGPCEWAYVIMKGSTSP